ncbi:glucarate dehydratase [Mameliella alba]|uniref:enolase C-terminal domain-like protein n=1 Tax=Mameliella alba TaxID=561184 RepID=UPI000882BC8D|nr:enolase C-terminal domain-like protein [Mameliella alba]OWV46801.1 glucarate dehydratase [Mameliella alba]PTR37719.1 glucarate dehydratase [Mameliella alba]GGF50470.1 glucarate dehydratase [Mameliella alba]SDD62842.1 glucarate dehydratase [Mameliella alba]
MPDTRIAELRVTPIAFYDPPLLNNAGCHQPFALRSIIEVETEGGVIGLGESYGTRAVLDGLAALAPLLPGLVVTDLNGLWARARQAVRGGHEGYSGDERLLPRVVGAVEVALWDALGKTTGRRVCDLLGGQVRDDVPFSAYLFYKFAGHSGADPDDWGEVLTPEQLVDEAHRFKELHGFDAIKLKAGILPPEEEIEGLRALRAAFPEAPLRIDPNGGWTVETTLRLLPQLEGLIEYLEDPTVGIEGNARVQAATDIPLATNMYVVHPSHLPANMAQDAFRVILSDHHYWGGLQASRELAKICEIWGLGLSMHSNSHLGISLAAMTHLAAATPNLTYDCDTHSPWQTDEVIEGGKLAFRNGRLRVPDGPGLGVTLDRTALARLHQNFLDAGITERDDATEMRKHWPDWQFGRPKF